MCRENHTGQPEVTLHLLPVATGTGFRLRMGDLYPEGTQKKPSGVKLGCLKREGLAERSPWSQGQKEVQGKTPEDWSLDGAFKRIGAHARTR